MNLWRLELRLLVRQRIALAALALLTCLTIAALACGMVEIAQQRRAIAAIPAAQAEDIGAIAAWIDKEKDAGSAAYYTFHPTWNAPSPLAFAAIGMRDVAPYILRVRSLGLEAQIHDGDIFNPELALPGAFDFAFVLVFLAPLFAIGLCHDLVSGEREAGRWRTLMACERGGKALFLRRTLLRLILLWAALGIPFLVAAMASGVASLAIFAIETLIAAYLLFWIGLCNLISRFKWSSTTNAASACTAWLILVLIVPTLAHIAINRAIPIHQGAEIALAQREEVNHAWDIPREDTMRRFYAKHPEWANSKPLGVAFHYKWYLAFHQNGDESVAADVKRYRAALEARDKAAHRLSWILPSVGVEAALSRLAQTDLASQLAYQDRIRAYHKRLREFFYAYLFTDRPFGMSDFAKIPRFEGI